MYVVGWWGWCLDTVGFLKTFPGCYVEDRLRGALVEVSNQLKAIAGVQVSLDGKGKKEHGSCKDMLLSLSMCLSIRFLGRKISKWGNFSSI